MSIDQNIDTVNKIADLGDKLINMSDIKNIFPSLKARQVFISEIEKNDELSTAQKMALLYHFNDVSKRAKNFYSVLELTEIMLNAKGVSLETAKIDTDSEWFGMFSDIAKNVSDEEMQHIWAKILASKCEDEKSVDKKLLSILQVMESEDAEIFSYICANTVYIDSAYISNFPAFVYVFDRNPVYVNGEFYNKKFIHHSALTQMQSLGLITYHVSMSTYELTAPNDMTADCTFNYFGEKINVKSYSKKDLSLGAVELTRCGHQLVKILYEGQRDNKNAKLIDKLTQHFNALGYEVTKV